MAPQARLLLATVQVCESCLQRADSATCSSTCAPCSCCGQPTCPCQSPTLLLCFTSALPACSGCGRWGWARRCRCCGGAGASAAAHCDVSLLAPGCAHLAQPLIAADWLLARVCLGTSPPASPAPALPNPSLQRAQKIKPWAFDMPANLPACLPPAPPACLRPACFCPACSALFSPPCTLYPVQGSEDEALDV